MSSKESWKTDREKLRQRFDTTLEHIWEVWESWDLKGSPFEKLEDIKDTEQESGPIFELYFDVGWARGVSEALGWSLSRPGPREWSPRD